jgi:hypothetical protein
MLDRNVLNSNHSRCEQAQDARHCYNLPRQLDVPASLAKPEGDVASEEQLDTDSGNGGEKAELANRIELPIRAEVARCLFVAFVLAHIAVLTYPGV